MTQQAWNYIHASVIGTSHIDRETPCQDYHVCRTLNVEGDEVFVAAVADGAGSASDGLTGADIACTQFVKEVETFFKEGGLIRELTLEFAQLWVESYQQKITLQAEAEGKKTRDYACTFLAVIAEEESSVFYQLGDGAIIYSAVERPELYYLGVIPAEGAYANTTDFLTDTNAAEKLQYRLLPQPVQDLAMFTDGLQSLAINYVNEQPEPHGQFIKPMLAPLKSNQFNSDFNGKLEEFLNSKMVNDRTDDDKTIVLASRNTNELADEDNLEIVASETAAEETNT